MRASAEGDKDVFTAAATAAPLPSYGAFGTDSGSMFTQTLGSSYFSGNGGASLYSGGFGGFGGSFGSSFGANNLGRGGYTGIGYTTPFDPFGPAPTGYGLLPNATPVFGGGAAAPATGLPGAAAPGGQVVYAHYAPSGAATTAGGAPATPAAPAPAAAPATAQQPKPADKPKPAEEKKDPKPEPKTVTVKSGDTLSKIAAAHGISWQKLYELNKGVVGGNPNLIRPGQELKLP